ncbi:hypothetical protein ABT158_22700 [Nonomuraea sp. NPDC001636]|uniref:hypothetical protein n=1 Tax=Nonomuraea sp. NPDC001636 TaxID=3154391 RepID=UPI0033303E9B
MSTCYQAIAIDDSTFERDLDGAPLPANHLVVVAEAQEHIEEDGTTMLVALPRIVAVIDTGVQLDDDAPNLDELLDRHGWKVTGDDSAGEDVHEVVPSDADAVPPAVTYRDGNPLSYYLAGRERLNTTGSIRDALLIATFTAAHAENPNVCGIDHLTIELLLVGAARAAVDERLAFERTELGAADIACKQRLFALACDAIGTALDLLRQRATCRTCDDRAVCRTADGLPTCANTSH